MAISFIPYAKQSITEDDERAVLDALKGEVITRGAKVSEFEKVIADYCGASYAVAFNTGTAALQAAYYAANVTASDRLISSPNTFIATVSGAVQRGASLRLVDIDRASGNIDIDQLEESLSFDSTRGRLILAPVHFSGIAVDMKRLDRLVRDPECLIIEDAAHALGSEYEDGQKVGCCAWSHMTIFSFHPAKTLTTGEGGMVLTNDSHLYHRLQLFRNNGIEREAPYLKEQAAPGYYEVQDLTGNYNFTDFQAALGLSQFKRLDQFIAKRRKLVRLYRDKLSKVPHLKLFNSDFDSKTAFHLFVVQIDFQAYGTTREVVMEKLKERGIGTQVHYIPLHTHPYFKNRQGTQELFLPENDLYYAQALSLPLYYDLTEEEVKKVCKELQQVLGKASK